MNNKTNIHQFELTIYNHQKVKNFDEKQMMRFHQSAYKAIPLVKTLEIVNRSVLPHLKEVEVNLVDDVTIADIHWQFMDISGATDVITFDHGEIYISVETAERQGEEYGNELDREIMLYLIHGLLHLAGYQDAEEPDRLEMDVIQQGILSKVW